jgi:valyl-tRNA synthetase
MGIVRQMRLESQELRFDERVCDEARRFNTKLWNALRFVVALPEGLPRTIALPSADALTIADKWIVTELRRCVEDVTRALDGFEMGVAAQRLHDFGWYAFCDWYLESTKAPSQTATRAAVLAYVLNTFVRAMHPIAPFISEEIWQTLPHDGATIVTASWPDIAEIPAFPEEAAMYAAFMTSVERIRNARAELELKPSEKVTLRTAPLPAAIVEQYELSRMTNAVLVVDANLPADVPFETLLAQIKLDADTGALRERYTREVARLDDEVARLEKKLGNDTFVARAKPDVVAAERAKLAEYERERERMRAALRGLGVAG